MKVEWPEPNCGDDVVRLIKVIELPTGWFLMALRFAGNASNN